MARLAAALLLVPALALAAPPKPADKPAGKPAGKAPAKTEAKPEDAGTPFPPYAASTAPVTVELVAKRFAETDARIHALRMRFRQSARLEGSDTVQSVEGTLAFRKPDFLRITHSVPEPQTIVSDGTWLWAYRPSNNQVIQTKLEAWRRSEPLARGLLDFGKSADLLERYRAAVSTVSAPDAAGYRTFELVLTPKPEEKRGEDESFELRLRASTRDFFPAEAVLRVGRASIRSLFQDVRLDPKIPDDAFRFVPPKDADVFKSQEQTK